MASLILSLVGALWLAFMVFFPEKWTSFVEKENGFWVKKGLMKAERAEKITRFEGGKGFKIIVGIGVLFSFLNSWIEMQ